MLKQRFVIATTAVALGLTSVAAPVFVTSVEHASSSITAVAATYTVTVKCQLVRFDWSPATTVGYIYGTGSGPNFQTALTNAKRDVDTRVPRGHYKRHCIAQN